jgi:transposase-like protein
MKGILEQEVRQDHYPDSGPNVLETIYPQLYCPRCGSYEIGLRRFQGERAVWGCRDCAVLFTLDFPGKMRF